MASYIKKGETILIPFRNGQSITDSQLKPRIYKTKEAFEKHFPGHYLGKKGVELVEYAEVVRCKDCRWRKNGGLCYMISGCGTPVGTGDDFFCSFGERKDNG